MRAERSTLDLDRQESAWWSRFAEVEDRFLWVQTPSIQRMLRGHYLADIVRLAGRSTPIAELGCGAGWLCIQLGQLGAHVVGVDFSEAQIRIARCEADKAGVADRVRFEVADASWFERTECRFSLVVMHGFLHHLTNEEIRRAIRATRRVISADGTLVVFEPVIYPASAEAPTRQQERYLRLLRWLAGLHQRGQGCGLRKIRKAEADARSVIASRDFGVPPHGPSPKEMPFTPGELPDLLACDFRVQRTKRVMVMSHVVAKENLLAELSHPWAARLIQWPILKLASWADRRLSGTCPPPPNIWVFEMSICSPR